jgi:hypothetical protein
VLLSSGLLRGDDVDNATTTTSAELHSACCQSEQGVVATAAYVGAWMEMSSTLTDQDLASIDKLSTKTLYAKTL